MHGRVRLLCPDGWSADPAVLTFVLPPGGRLDTDVMLTMAAGAPPGLYPVRAELAVTGSDVASMPPAWRRWSRTCVWCRSLHLGDDVLRLISDPEPVELSAGEAARLTVVIGTDAHADVAVEAHLITPWGAWEWMGPAAVAVNCTPGVDWCGLPTSGRRSGCNPGQWWGADPRWVPPVRFFTRPR